MPKQIELTLHLGAHKTASTHLQNSLLDHSQTLIDAGVRYYGPDFLRMRGRNIPTLFGLSRWEMVGKPRRTPLEQLKFLAKGSRKVVLSDENFLGPLHRGNGRLADPLYEDAARRLRDLSEVLPDVKLRVFLSIRSPDSFINSAYSQTVYSGSFLSPEVFSTEHPASLIDWLTLVSKVSAVPGVDEVHVWRYEDYAKVFPDIIRRLLRWRLGGIVVPREGRNHVGLSARALAQALSVRDAENVVQLVQQARKDFPVGAEFERFNLFSEAERELARASYAEQIEQIRALPKVVFYQPDAGLVDAEG